MESIVGSKVIKAPGIKSGGVLIAEGKQFASIVIGQDMSVGFVGPQGADYEFKIVGKPHSANPSAFVDLRYQVMLCVAGPSADAERPVTFLPFAAPPIHGDALLSRGNAEDYEGAEQDYWYVPFSVSALSAPPAIPGSD